MPNLENTRVVVTRPRHQAPALVALLQQRGAVPIVFPTIEVVATEGPERAEVDAALTRLTTGVYTGVLITSANAARFFLQRLRPLTSQAPATALRSVPMFAIGEATAAALREGGDLRVVVSTTAVSEGLGATVRATFGDRLAAQRLLVPRARQGRDAAVNALRDAGAQVDVVALYETRPQADSPPPPGVRHADWVTFTSPSAVRGFLDAVGTFAGAVACIGPTTAAAAKDHGLEVAAVARSQSVLGLVEAMEQAP